MAWIPTTPEDRTIPGPPIIQAANRFLIEELVILPHGGPDGAPAVRLVVAEGYDAAGVFIEISRTEVCVPDAKHGEDAGMGALLTHIGALADGAASIYANTRDAAYALLVELGELPEGSSA